MITIATVAIPGSLHSALHGIGEILYMANDLAGKKIFNYSILSLGVEQVSCYTGTLITPEKTISNSS